MIEVTQSKVANTIQTTELQNLPMITRTISGMLELLPGAAPVGRASPDQGEHRDGVVRGIVGRQRDASRWTAPTTATTTTAAR